MRKNRIGRILLLGCIVATLFCVSACAVQPESQIIATLSDSVSQESTTPEPTSQPQSTIIIDYGRIDFTPAERDAFFAELATMEVLTDSGQLAPSEAVLVYATATEAAVLMPFVDAENGERAWLEIALFKQGEKWQAASVQSENDFGTVYFCDADQDAINQLWIDIVRNGQDPYTQYRQYIADADGDGTDEIFTLVTSSSNTAEPAPCVLWCYHDRTYEKIGEVTVCDLGADVKSQGEDAPHWMTVGTRKLFTLSESTGLSTWANVYTVQDGEVIVFEGIGQSIEQGDESAGEASSDFTVMVSAYDADYMLNASNDGFLYTGRTTKPYSLYWDEENCIFREYGAVQISIESLGELGAVGNIDAITVQMQTDGTNDPDALHIEAVYQFANDTYKINYRFGNDETGSCYYLAYRLENGVLTDETPTEHSGWYLPAAYLELAVYPTQATAYPTAINVPAAEIETLLLESWYEASPAEAFRKAVPDAKCTASDLDEDGNQETWFLVEDYNRVLALVVEAQPDGSFTYLGMTENLWQYDGEASTSLQLYQGDGQSVAYAQCVRSGAVAAAGVQTYDVFVTIKDDGLICDAIYYSSLTGEMEDVDGVAATYHLDVYSGGAVSKEVYLAQRDAYLCGALFEDDAVVIELKTVEDYETEGAFATKLNIS